MQQLIKQINKIIKAKDRIVEELPIKQDNTILIVDDEENIASLLKRFFEKKGYKTLTAQSGAKAIELVKQEDIAVALLDIQMPGMDGLQTLEELLKIKPKLGVVMLTGLQEDEKVKKAIEMGAYNYVLKPFDFLYIELVIMSRLAIAQE